MTRNGEEIVHIEDNSGNLYMDTVANFAVDNGSALPALPVDAVKREYMPGSHHFTRDASAQKTNQPNPWTEGDAIISDLNTIVIAKYNRDNPPPTLDEYKTAARMEIDVVAGGVRQKYITSIQGQDAVYLMKYDEAVAYKDAGYPVIGGADEYPHLTAEAVALGQTEQQVADTVIATREAWVMLSAAIEGERLGGKNNVSNAADTTAVDVAVSTTTAALDAI